MCLSYPMQSVGRLELILYHTSSNICDFHFPVDFGLNIRFPHIFLFLHQNRVGKSGFTLKKLRIVGDEDKIILSSLDTRTSRSSIITQPVLPQSAFCAQKKQRPKLDRLKFLVLHTF